jgi:hypothetical protein
MVAAPHREFAEGAQKGKKPCMESIVVTADMRHRQAI